MYEGGVTSHRFLAILGSAVIAEPHPTDTLFNHEEIEAKSGTP